MHQQLFVPLSVISSGGWDFHGLRLSPSSPNFTACGTLQLLATMQLLTTLRRYNVNIEFSSNKFSPKHLLLEVLSGDPHLEGDLHSLQGQASRKLPTHSEENVAIFSSRGRTAAIKRLAVRGTTRNNCREDLTPDSARQSTKCE